MTMTGMMEKYVVPSLLSDLYLSYYGSQICPPGHRYGPAVRDHYLYVYILKGRGVYRVKDREYPMREGQSFILFPNELTLYEADEREPWHYVWIGFGGKSAHPLLERSDIHVDRPVLTLGRPERMQELFERLLQYEPLNGPADELFMTGVLCAILAEISGECDEPPSRGQRDGHPSRVYVAQALNFMNQHYDKNIQVREVARYVGLERTYFSKLFKSGTGLSPYEYIMDLRLAEGKRLLRDTGMPVEHIALRIGFKDTFHFSSFFKNKAGCSPLQYRKSREPSHLRK